MLKIIQWVLILYQNQSQVLEIIFKALHSQDLLLPPVPFHSIPYSCPGAFLPVILISLLFLTPDMWQFKDLPPWGSCIYVTVSERPSLTISVFPTSFIFNYSTSPDFTLVKSPLTSFNLSVSTNGECPGYLWTEVYIGTQWLFDEWMNEI